MVRRNKQHDEDRFLLYFFDGSSTYSANAWNKKLDTFLQQHQILEDEAIRVAALHLGGEVYAWWLFESFTLKNVNTPSAMFIRTLMKRFGRKNSKTHVEETNTFKQKKPLHVMEEFRGSISL